MSRTKRRQVCCHRVHQPHGYYDDINNDNESQDIPQFSACQDEGGSS